MERQVGVKESKQTERTRLKEQLCDFLFIFKYGHFLFFFFFFNWPYFQTSLLQEERSNRFSWS